MERLCLHRGMDCQDHTRNPKNNHKMNKSKHNGHNFLCWTKYENRNYFLRRTTTFYGLLPNYLLPTACCTYFFGVFAKGMHARANVSSSRHVKHPCAVCSRRNKNTISPKAWTLVTACLVPHPCAALLRQLLLLRLLPQPLLLLMLLLIPLLLRRRLRPRRETAQEYTGEHKE